MSSPAVTTILVTYRSVSTIEAALDALRPARDRGLVECIVVDNASDDGTPELVRERYDWVRVIDSGGNLGFGRANNIGLDHATAPFVLFLNPDALVSADDLQRMVDHLHAHPGVGIVGPALENDDGRPQAALPFPTPGRVLRESMGRVRAEDQPVPIEVGSAPRRVDWLCGAALLARKSVLDELGGFDPRFFLYFEETDLCYRARLRGHETWLVGEARARHMPHTSARSSSKVLYRGCIAEHFFQSRYYYLAKHHGRYRAAAVELADVALSAARAVVRWLRRKPHVGELVTRLRGPWLRMPPRHRPADEL